MNQEETWLLEEKYKGTESEAFRADCERLKNGEPLAYIIGYIPFLNCQIFLDSRPLIPRPETEFWVNQAISKINDTEAPRVLDLCAGSGAIGIAVAKACEAACVDFVEIDPVHHMSIHRNLEENVPHKITQNKVFVSDLYENIPDKTYHFILSNPPYIDKAAETVAESVALHEPHLALFGGKDGMEIIERVISGAKASLSPHGQLWIEHEPFQSAAIQKLASANGFSCQTQKDQYHTERYSILTTNVAE